MKSKQLRDLLVDRFLRWPLPRDFAPDGGISFTRIPNHQPVGTNLLTADQARGMIDFLLTDSTCPHCDVTRPHTHTVEEIAALNR